MKPTKLQLIYATISRSFGYYLLYNSLFIVLGVISIGAIITSGPLEPFKIGNTVIPRFIVGGTNLSVALLCLVGIILVTFVFIRRYLHHRKTINFLRRKGLYDYDGDGKIDTFMDEFLDD